MSERFPDRGREDLRWPSRVQHVRQWRGAAPNDGDATATRRSGPWVGSEGGGGLVDYGFVGIPTIRKCKPRASGDDPIKPALTSFMGT